MPSFSVKVSASGPLFDGVAAAVAARVVREAARDLAEGGQVHIKIKAGEMDRSGRGGTGRASAGVELRERSDGYLIWGAMNKGEVWWPWLEGVSQRNATTGFKGYHTFRNEAAAMRKRATGVLERHLADHIREMGGG